MDDFVARALYYYQLAFDHNLNDVPSWEDAPETTRTDLLLQARTAIEAYEDWLHSRGLADTREHIDALNRIATAASAVSATAKHGAAYGKWSDIPDERMAELRAALEVMGA